MTQVILFGKDVFNVSDLNGTKRVYIERTSSIHYFFGEKMIKRQMIGWGLEREQKWEKISGKEGSRNKKMKRQKGKELNVETVWKVMGESASIKGTNGGNLSLKGLETHFHLNWTEIWRLVNS